MQHNEDMWSTFAEQEGLTEDQLNQFKIYYHHLIQWNVDVNLTRITELPEVIAYHFRDSLSVGHTLAFDGISSIADIGSGAGFPSIPLKIKYPHVHVTIIEVSGKRIEFLNHIITLLGLAHITILHLDWRTFLRKHNVPVDYFFARASLAIPELLRMFKHVSGYQASTLVYWASEKWVPEGYEQSYIKSEYAYSVGDKRRKLVFFVRKAA